MKVSGAHFVNPKLMSFLAHILSEFLTVANPDSAVKSTRRGRK
jgi:hypothetical protein